jgi:hypothetical protein
MEVSAQLHAPAALPHGKSPWYPLDSRLDGPQSVLDAVVNIPSPRRKSNPRTPIFQPVAQRYTDWANTAHYNIKGIFIYNYKEILFLFGRQSESFLTEFNPIRWQIFYF